MSRIEYPETPWERCTRKQLLTGIYAAIATRDRAIKRERELREQIEAIAATKPGATGRALRDALDGGVA